MGVFRAVVLLTVIAIAFSVSVTSLMMWWHFGEKGEWAFGLSMAILAPLLGTPLMFGFVLRLMHQLEMARRQIHRLAFLDELTGVNNRRHFMTEAAAEFGKAKRYELPMSVIMLDADNFKRINDIYGHARGDDVLRKIAAACQDGLRNIDILARYGGEEFVILLPVTDAQSARIVAERVRANVAELHVQSGNDPALKVTISLGVATCAAHTVSLEALLHRADQALYRAKRNGRNQVQHADDKPLLAAIV